MSEKGVMTVSSMQTDQPLLTAAGRRDVQTRLDRAQRALAQLSQRMIDAERTSDEIAQHRRIQNQVEELTTILRQATDITAVEEDPTIVEVGDEVDLEDPDGEVDTYAVVHPAEARISDGRISSTSPLGRAVLGARVGDHVLVEAPAGTYRCLVRDRRRLN